MQWLRDSWIKEGPGIAKDAPKKQGIALFAEILLREWWEMVKLNLLFVLASLPLVTIPASLAAMATVSVAFVEDRNAYLARDFLAAFRRHFAAATVVGVVLGGAIALGAYAVVSYASLANKNLMFAAPLAVSLGATAFLCIFACHFLVLMVMRDLSYLQLARLAALASLARPMPAIGALGVVAALWLVHILFYPISVFMPATANFSLGMFAVTFAVHRAANDVLSMPAASRAGLEANPRGPAQNT
jgi:uncharacterized membrane protein YesL